MSARRWLAAGLTLPLLALAPAAHQAPARKYICEEFFGSLVLTRKMGAHGIRDFDATGKVGENCTSQIILSKGTVYLEVRKGLTGKWTLAAKPVRWINTGGTVITTISGICHLNAYERLRVDVHGYAVDRPPSKHYRRSWPFFGRGMRTVNCDRRYPAN